MWPPLGGAGGPSRVMALVGLNHAAVVHALERTSPGDGGALLRVMLPVYFLLPLQRVEIKGSMMNR